MSEIDLRGQPNLLDQKVMYAKWLAKADLLPVAYRDKPANVLLAIEAGEALGIPPVSAINMINVIAGKPTISAGLMAALVRQAGHRIRVETDTADAQNPSATATLYRKDDPQFAFTATWDYKRAIEAGLGKKDNWLHYRINMVKARAISEVCRDGCPEVLAGFAYTPEELGEQFLTDTEREDQGLMTRHELAEHSQLERLPHDRGKTERLHAGDPDPDAAIWETGPAAEKEPEYDGPLTSHGSDGTYAENH